MNKEVEVDKKELAKQIEENIRNGTTEIDMNN